MPVNAPSTEAKTRQPPAREIAKILNECRDLAVQRLTSAFAQILDRVGDLLMERASNTDIREEQQLFLDARGTLKGERPALMAEFERQLRKLIDERIAGKSAPKADFSKVDATNLTLVETASMDESVLTGNITRVVENLCHDELAILNRGMGLPARAARPGQRRQSARPGNDRRRVLASGPNAQGRPQDPLPDHEGPEPGSAGRYRFDLRRPQPASDAAQHGAGAGARGEPGRGRRSRGARAPTETDAPCRRRNRRDGDVQAHVRRREPGAPPPAAPSAFGGPPPAFGAPPLPPPSSGLPSSPMTAGVPGAEAGEFPHIGMPGRQRRPGAASRRCGPRLPATCRARRSSPRRTCTRA